MELNKKVKHPFQVPDNFFTDFKNETIDELEGMPQKTGILTRKLVLQFTKYAAIIVFSFFLGRVSMFVINGDKEISAEDENYSIDEVMLQIQEEDITDFFIEDISLESIEI